ncbi:MAG: hypothetical protein J3Q66DRAFT_379739 [Benniella sp.]|nr:MAG: hypothetical protein J3Q66DRAFT_379739 [Benniella sp.]
MSSPITINVKASNDRKHTISIAVSDTVLELKKKVAENCDTPAERIRLIYSGKVLQDEHALATYKILDGHTVHMVRSAVTPAAQPSAPTTSHTPSSSVTSDRAPLLTQGSASISHSHPAGAAALPNPWTNLMSGGGGAGGGAGGGLDGLGGGSIGMESTMMAQMMQDPNFAQYMSSMLQNPQVLESMFSMNPAMQAMGPEARAILRSPLFQQMISNPDTLRQIAQMNSQLGGSMARGGSGMGLFGFNHPWPTPATMRNPFSAMSGAATGTTGAGVAGNPMASFLAQQMGAMREAAAGTGGLHPSPRGQQQQQRPEERFEVQLKQLNDMGFWDAAKNIRALQAAGGNVNSAIELLFSGSD